MLIDQEASIYQLNSNTSPAMIAQRNQAQKTKERACSNEGPRSKSEESTQAEWEKGDAIRRQQSCVNRTGAGEEARNANYLSNHYWTSDHQRKHQYAHDNLTTTESHVGTEENWRHNQRATTAIATTKEYTQPQPKNSTPAMRSSFFLK